MVSKKYILFPYNHDLIQEARRMRKTPTKAEACFWDRVRHRKLGWRCFRQKVIYSFIVDFYFPELLLAVEIDGEIHKHQLEYDEERSLFLEHFGIKILRYSNNQILDNWGWVKQHLTEQLKQRAEALPSGEGLGWG